MNMSRKKGTKSGLVSTEWKKFRLSLDLNQKEFSEKLGVTSGYISDIESGKKEPSHTLSELFRLIRLEAQANTHQLNTNTQNEKENGTMLQDLVEMQKRVIDLQTKDLSELKLENELLKKAASRKKQSRA